MTYEPPRDADGKLLWEEVQDDLEIIVKAVSEQLHGGLGNGFVLMYSSVHLPEDMNEPVGYKTDYYISKDCDLTRAAGIMAICDKKYTAGLTHYIYLRGNEDEDES